ncbi:MAG TPA: hypothetical protein VN032_04940 [Thermoanaerobaculia bacterium]|nr:hypothetical protein [Thermoanaerobaculia bacterium]
MLRKVARVVWPLTLLLALVLAQAPACRAKESRVAPTPRGRVIRGITPLMTPVPTRSVPTPGAGVHLVPTLPA